MKETVYSMMLAEFKPYLTGIIIELAAIIVLLTIIVFRKRR